MPRKHALLIGINYLKTNVKLRGCINDAYQMKKFLHTKFNYGDSDFTMLTEIINDIKPNRGNILAAFEKIVNLANSGCDEILIHYSGHGVFVPDTNLEESDRRDEAIVPIDYKTYGFISDDVIKSYIMRLPEGCKCVLIFDCCHSGTVADLPFRMLRDGVFRKENFDVPRARVVMYSGCLDSQKSYDAYNLNKNKEWSGALTTGILRYLRNENSICTCYQLLHSARKFIDSKGYPQTVQMSTSVVFDKELLFSEHGGNGFIQFNDKPIANVNVNAPTITRPPVPTRRRRPVSVPSNRRRRRRRPTRVRRRRTRVRRRRTRTRSRRTRTRRTRTGRTRVRRTRRTRVRRTRVRRPRQRQRRTRRRARGTTIIVS